MKVAVYHPAAGNFFDVELELDNLAAEITDNPVSKFKEILWSALSCYPDLISTYYQSVKDMHLVCNGILLADDKTLRAQLGGGALVAQPLKVLPAAQLSFYLTDYHSRSYQDNRTKASRYLDYVRLGSGVIVGVVLLLMGSPLFFLLGIMVLILVCNELPVNRKTKMPGPNSAYNTTCDLSRCEPCCSTSQMQAGLGQAQGWRNEPAAAPPPYSVDYQRQQGQFVAVPQGWYSGAGQIYYYPNPQAAAYYQSPQYPQEYPQPPPSVPIAPAAAPGFGGQ